MQMAYLDRINWKPRSRFYIEHKLGNIPIWFRTIENAIRFSNKKRDIGFFSIFISHSENESYEFPDDHILSCREVIDLRIHASDRLLYIASDLSQVYAERFIVGGHTVYMDYDYVFGNLDCFKIDQCVSSSLLYWEGKKFILDYFGYNTALENRDANERYTKEQIMKLPYRDDLQLLYNDSNSIIVGDPKSKNGFFGILPLVTLREVKEG